MSFLLKTVLGVASIEAVLLLLLLLSSNYSLNKSFMEGLHKRANSTVALLDTTARDAIFSKDLATLESFVQHAVTNPDVSFIRIQDTDGMVLAEAGEAKFLQVGLRTPDTLDNSLDDGVYDARVAVSEGGITYAYIELGLSTRTAEMAQASARNRNLFIAGTELLLVALFSLLLGRYLTRELSRMKKAAHAIASGQFGYQVPVVGKDEIADTIRTLNEMSLKIKQYSEQQKLSERREFEGKDRLSGILSTISEGVLLLNEDLVVEYANPIGRSFLAHLFADQDDKAPIELFGGHPVGELLSPTRPTTRELSVVINDSERFFEFSAALVDHKEAIVEWVVVLRDITQSRQSHESAKKQARLAAIGQLSAGIAHDFNNILSVIIGVSDLSLARAPHELDDELREDLECILEQGKQASEMVRHVLDFSRKEHESELNSIELNAFLGSLTRLLSRTISRTVHLDWVPYSEELWIHCGTTNLQQVVTNIILNGVDANKGEGVITVRLERRDTDREGNTPHRSSWICLSIADDGAGIEDKDLPHIFEPFFTTKPIGEGTGLGLAQAFELLKKHDGRLEVESTVGVGSSFQLYFQEMIRQVIPFTEYEGEPELYRQITHFAEGKQILLVDDDDEVRAAIQAMLVRLGCEVLVASDGEEGIRLFLENSLRLDAVISDVVMPRMAGPEMVVRMRQEHHCKIPIVFLSGYIPEEEIDMATLGSYIDAFLHKPVEFHTLAQLMEELFEVSSQEDDCSIPPPMF